MYLRIAPEVGTVSDGEGVESKELSIKESKQIAKESKNEGFDPEKHGYKKAPLIDEIRINYVDQALKGANPSIVGVAVTVIFGTIKDSILVAAGKMSADEMGMHFVDTLVVSTGYLVSMKIGGAIAQALCPELPEIGYAIGSLLGCSVAVVYNIGKKKLISFCVDTGFTCFGLVEQSYELPEEILHEMRVHTVPIRLVCYGQFKRQDRRNFVTNYN